MFVIANSNTLYSECDFIVMLSDKQQSISNMMLNSNSFGYDNPNAMFSFIKSKSTNSSNNDGYGIIYYNSESRTLLQHQKFFQTGFNTSNETHPKQFSKAINSISQEYNNASIVLAHVRKTSQGAIGNHPFTMEITQSSNNKLKDDSYALEIGNTTYTFQHNGDCTPLREAMFGYLKSRDDDWFDNFSSNWMGNKYSVEQWIDSELLFHFIMSFVIDKDGDVLSGMLSALSYKGEYGDFEEAFHDLFNTYRVNIVLSDGESVYIFRNTRLNGSSFNLSYKKYDTGLICVKTRDTLPDGVRIGQFSLTKILKNGDVFTIPNIYERPNFELNEITNYELGQNYPNPFNPHTRINYELQITDYELAEIVVYNATGQKVWSSPVTRYGSPVTDFILFDGSSFNSGIYYYSLVVDGKQLFTKKMVLIK